MNFYNIFRYIALLLLFFVSAVYSNYMYNSGSFSFMRINVFFLILFIMVIYMPVRTAFAARVPILIVFISALLNDMLNGSSFGAYTLSTVLVFVVLDSNSKLIYGLEKRMQCCIFAIALLSVDVVIKVLHFCLGITSPSIFHIIVFNTPTVLLFSVVILAKGYIVYVQGVRRFIINLSRTP